LVHGSTTIGNPLRCRAIAELSNGHWISDMNLLRNDFDPAEGRVFYHGRRSTHRVSCRLP
jgi:hypothetical protein